jgi:hypothetical protein
MDPFNALSTAAAARKIPPLKEAPPAKVMSCAFVASKDLEKDLDAVKEITGGAGTPSAKMAGWPANSYGQSAMVCGHVTPRDEGQSPLVCQGSRCTRGYGTHLARALSPRPMIRTEHRLVMPTCPTMGILTPRKDTVRHQLVMKHDARVDLNPSSARILYTQEPALVSDLPQLSPPCYIVIGQ